MYAALPQGQPHIADVSGVPYVAFTEKSVASPTRNNLVVFKWVSGSTFSQVGTTLNVAGKDASLVTSVSIVSNGSQPCVVWIETTVVGVSNGWTHSKGQTYAKCWNSTTWVSQGAAVNVNTSFDDMQVSATYLGGKLYAAFTERSDALNAQLPKLWIRSFNGTSWATVGSSYLNRDQSVGWASAPSLSNDGTNLLIAWGEQGNNSYTVPLNSFSSSPQIYVASCTALGTCTSLGGTLNINPSIGSGVHPSISSLSGVPITAWRETIPGSLGQIYAKQWNGTDWTRLTTVSCSINTASLPDANTGLPYSQTASQSGCSPSTWSVSSGSLPSWATLNTTTGVISGTASGSGTATFRLAYSTATSASLSITTNSAVSIGLFPTPVPINH